jgi:RND family efflux transporter MFP subunit
MKSVVLSRAARLSGTVLCLLHLAGCAEETGSHVADRPPMVRVQQPIVRSVTDYEYFTGRTKAPDSLDVRAKVNGYLYRWNFDKNSTEAPTKDFNFVPGQEVKREQVLFKIDPRPYQAVYDQALAQIKLAEAQLTLAQADYARALQVQKTPGAISQQDVDKYLAAQGKAAAEVEAQKANAESARLNLMYTDVKTDVTGIVSRNLLSVGNLVEANTLLATVVSQDPMYGYFDVDETTVERIARLMREGKLKSVREGENKYEKYPVDLGLSDGSDYPFTGYVDYVSNQVDPSTGTLPIRVVIANPQPPQGPRVFIPDMYLRVRLPIGEAHQALLVPQAAIQTDQSQKYVLVVNAQNVVEMRPIDVGQVEDGGLQVVIPVKIVSDTQDARRAKEGEQGEDSLTDKDRIIIGGLQRVRPDMKVEIKPSE